MEPKALFALAAFIVVVISYIPYLRSMFRGVTKPHAYTWLIWALTGGIAAFGSWYGGGGYGALAQIITTGFTALLFLLSLRYGTRDITRSDQYLLGAALVSLIPWLLFQNPLISVLLVTGIDAIAYIPTLRKLYSDPWSEPLVAWGTFTLAPFLLILALQQYSILTLAYLSMTIFFNILLLLVSVARRSALREYKP